MHIGVEPVTLHSYCSSKANSEESPLRNSILKPNSSNFVLRITKLYFFEIFYDVFNNSDESPPLSIINEIMLHKTLLPESIFHVALASCAILSPALSSSDQELFSLLVS